MHLFFQTDEIPSDEKIYVTQVDSEQYRTKNLKSLTQIFKMNLFIKKHIILNMLVITSLFFSGFPKKCLKLNISVINF